MRGRQDNVMGKGLIVVTDDNFQEKVLESPKPVLVEFSASRCDMCRMMLPILEAIATEIGPLIRVVLVDVDRNPNTALAYSVDEIPTLSLFKNGECVMQCVGLAPMKSIMDRITAYLPE